MSPRDGETPHQDPTGGANDRNGPIQGQDRRSSTGDTQRVDDRDVPVVDTDRALYEEYRLFLDQEPPEFPQSDAALDAEMRRLEQEPRFALCLSGGGIRSAAFCMGALRALAMKGQLTRFHYLSMVSGGGYIGSWLMRVAHERRISPQGGPARAHNGPGPKWLEDAADVLGKSQDRPEVKNLREFTDFLSPKPGLLSGDLGANAVLYLRNLIATWIIILPAILAITLVPVFYRDLICFAGSHPLGAFDGPQLLFTGGVLAIGLLALGWSTYSACLSIPSHGHDLCAEMWKREQAGANPAGAEAGAGVRPGSPASEPEAIGRTRPAPGEAAAREDEAARGEGSGGKDTARAKQRGERTDAARPPGSRGDTLVGRPAAGIRRDVILPSLVWAFAIPVVFAAISQPPEASLTPWSELYAEHPRRSLTSLATAWPLLEIGVAALPGAVMFGAFLAAWIKLESRSAKHAEVFSRNWGSWLLGCVVSSSTLFGALLVGRQARVDEIATLGPLVVIVGLVLQTTIYLALRQHSLRSELDREWHAKVNARLLTWTAAYTVLTALVLLPACWLDTSKVTPGSLLAWIGTPAAAAGLSIVTMVTQRVRNWVGTKDGAAVSRGVSVWGVALSVAAATFAISMIVLVSLLGQRLVWFFTPDAEVWTGWPAAALLSVFVILLCGAIAWKLGERINVNRFSLHAIYRNRLVRAFLGSARESRHPDSFVRFDAEDNIRLTELLPEMAKQRGFRKPTARVEGGWTPMRLYPVFGVTLNLAGASRTDWTERKSAPFTLSPLHCGSAELHHGALADMLASLNGQRLTLASQLVRGGWGGNRARSGAYARTSTYAGAGKLTGDDNDEETGITLGAAMALSGAAVSPNMGSRTTPALAFLGTILDLRLGMWLPNPAQAPMPAWDPVWRRWTANRSILAAARTFLNKGKPGNALKALYWELEGRTDATRDSLYLSDGGHFDNLGLYEMLRRRCRRIVVIDAGYDPNYAYEDLATTLRRASIDLEIKVEFTNPIKVGCKELPEGGLLARITYLARTDVVSGQEIRGEAQGELLVIRPWLPADLPVEVAAYRAGNGSFPHDVTSNQAFTESQFESYRRLGEFITHLAADGVRDLLDTGERVTARPRVDA